MDSNAAGSSRWGAADAKIAAINNYATSEHFSPAERAALALADAMTSTPPAVDDALFARVQEHFAPAQLVELAAIVCQENLRSRFNTTFRIGAIGLYCPLPATVAE